LLVRIGWFKLKTSDWQFYVQIGWLKLNKSDWQFKLSLCNSVYRLAGSSWTHPIGSGQKLAWLVKMMAGTWPYRTPCIRYTSSGIYSKATLIYSDGLY